MLVGENSLTKGGGGYWYESSSDTFGELPTGQLSLPEGRWSDMSGCGGMMVLCSRRSRDFCRI